MENLLNKHQKIKLSGKSASHQNGTTQHAIKIVVTITSTMLINAGLTCLKDILSTYFGQWKWTRLYVSKIVYLIYSQVYHILRHVQEQYLSRYWKSEIIVMFGVVWYVYQEQRLKKPGVKIIEWYSRSKREINMGFNEMISTKVGLVLKLFNG